MQVHMFLHNICVYVCINILCMNVCMKCMYVCMHACMHMVIQREASYICHLGYSEWRAWGRGRKGEGRVTGAVKGFGKVEINHGEIIIGSQKGSDVVKDG